MARLMEHVRLPLLPREYLVQVSTRTRHWDVYSVCLLACQHAGYRSLERGKEDGKAPGTFSAAPHPRAHHLFLEVGFHPLSDSSKY